MDASSFDDSQSASARPASLRSRLGMSARMAIGFAALAATMLGANVLTQRSTQEERDHMRQLVVQHEPVVRATELLANALGEYERSVLAYVEGRSANKVSLEEAPRRLEEAAAAYVKLDSDAQRQDSMRQLVEDLQLYRSLGTALVRQAEARRARIAEYHEQFARVEARVAEPQARAARFAGAVFTSQALLDLSRALNLVRERFVAAIASSATSDRAVAAAEAEFRAMLHEHADNLARTQGVQWLAYLKVEFSSLVSARRLAFETTLDLQRRLAEFRDQGDAVSGIVRVQLIEPARRSLADAQVLADSVAKKADRQLALATIAVLAVFCAIAVLTVVSVTGPVRRLARATREIASGAVRTRVVRGGVKELDSLAVAFNGMAERLEQAQAEVRRHHAQLEARVAERTRELQYLAHHDPLTQLPNRRHLFMRLEAALQRARTNESRVAVLFIDLDNFKTISAMLSAIACCKQLANGCSRTCNSKIRSALGLAETNSRSSARRSERSRMWNDCVRRCWRHFRLRSPFTDGSCD
jgi:HAMP domain-containing protein